MSLLRSIKAVPTSTNIRDFAYGDHLLTSEEAELIVAADNLEASEPDDKTVPNPLVDLKSAIDKIRKISRIMRSSPQRMELFKTIAERVEEDNEQSARVENRVYKRKSIKNLILDVVTRWNSTCLMLERALEFSEAIDSLTSHLKHTIYRPYALSAGDWAAISAVCRWLKFFRGALVRMSGENYPTLSFSLHIYFVLIAYATELEKESIAQQNPAVLSGVRACKGKLQEVLNRSTKDSQYYYYAMVLDPRYKDSLFKLHSSTLGEILPQEWISSCIESFTSTATTHYGGTANGSMKSQLNTGARLNVDEFDYALHAAMPQWHRQDPESTSIVREIEEYLAEPITTLDPLTWWSKHEPRFPKLTAMARDYLCIPGSSVAVERVLSTGRDVISLRRASLSAETIRALMTYRADIILEKSTRGFSQV